MRQVLHPHCPENDFALECYQQTGKWPLEFPRGFFWSPDTVTKGLNRARGGIGDGNYLAKAAVRYHRAQVLSIQSIWPRRTVGAQKEGKA